MTNPQGRHPEEGQTMAEYAVVLAVITPFLILTFGMLADDINARIEAMIGFLT
ncbi:MAG TPA: hypothetical protein VFN93_01000 [Gaiellaceae bacterium]|nr:hypothetical protein [Gaiellaceae bacterium]